MSLDKYQQKRRFEETPEPTADAAGSDSSKTLKNSARPRFVIHKHDATHLHFDLRLEHASVLKSWAVPRGPSIHPSRRRLAVATEDHPLAYLDFEGLIPKGNYGAGPMLIWDRGYWVCETSADEAFDKGKVKIELHGHRLQGRWTLVRSGGSDSNQWLLIREKKDPLLVSGHAPSAATEEPVVSERTSVVSGRTLEQIGSEGSSEQPTVGDGDGLNQALEDLPKVAPMLPTLVERPPQGEQWVHELKLDGYRMQVRVASGKVQLLTRNGIDWTDRLPEIADAVASLPVKSAVFDCELVSLASDGSTDFSSLQTAFRDRRTGKLVMFFFDVLFLDGEAMNDLPLLERKQRLAPIIRQAGIERLQYLDHFSGSPSDLLQQCRDRGLEGIVSKRGDKPYREGRTRLWLKVKSRRRDRFVIGGYDRSSNAVAGLGALAVGYFATDGKFRYCGKVGGGWSQQSGKTLLRLLESERRKNSPFADDPASAMNWVNPRIVVEVSFTNLTKDGRLRHPTLTSVEEGLPPESVTRDDVSVSIAEGDFASADPAGTSPGPEGADANNGRDEDAATTASLETLGNINITNPDRILFPAQGITKAELVRYLVQVSQWLLPHIEDRIVSFVRCPQGIENERFFQRHHQLGLAPSIASVPLQGESKPMLTVASVEGLVAAAQMNVIEFHPWGCRIDRLERADRIVFDLDPDSAVPWSQIVDAAWMVRDALKRRGLDAFVKTTGSKGLHVVVPIARRYPWDRVAQWCSDFADSLVASNPKRLTAHLSKRSRRGKIFLDHLRNRRSATAVAPYSPRARSGAPVSVPLSWEELAATQSSEQWTMRSLPARLRMLSEDPWEGMFKNHQRLK